ncbi:unnamed protein product [Colletotrichum noveboracense]|uniref:Uncharacterized protein n=1 Tax=Colletotrichum noveboracense TaxID=2664923 RepID=A0A9W4WFF9_9PEZI|nr:hypothetical protein K456DRAFT_57022 [Colletotrichum gloeosporioides 23]KAJ0285252.1 hypothetical protein COL940_003669 [Colletotrichum noveboracense]KAJ0289847.1 hypothetical protein CBS470a_004195 [Colletotrichum nupharicola]KAJ0309799.1 hypothetical protein Brms1b_008960 [Colletotrichum noveboracense]CAI0654118.1 unnamed protein product [Colletotrichum noveboracense]
MSDNWFSSKLAPDGDIEDGCHPQEAQAMKDYLHQKTNAAEAARAITNPVATAENPGEDLVRQWGFLMDSLVELPAQHVEALVELLKAIENLPEPDFTSLDESKRPSEKLWKGLPGFGNLWADSYQSGSWRKAATAAKGPERDVLRDAHVRKAEIEARLVAAGIGAIPIDWGYEVVADALESSNALLDFEVPAAAKWLAICGQQFRKGAGGGDESWALKPHDTASTTTPSRDLSKASWDQKLSLERWSWWEGRLRELHGENGVVKDAATTALGAMSKTSRAQS